MAIRAAAAAGWAACFLFILLLAAPLRAAAQEPEEGFRFTTRAMEIVVSGRVQTLFSTSSIPDVPVAQWEMRRARVEFKIQVHPLLSGRLQSELAGGSPGVRDGNLTLHLTPGFQVLFGRAFRPFSVVQQTSSTVMLPIERGAVIRGLPGRPFEHFNLLQSLGYLDRDTGMQIFGSPPGLPGLPFYALAISNGPLQARSGDRSTYQLTGRLRVQPVAGLRLGGAWSRRDFLDQREEGGTALALRSGQAWEVDFEYGSFAPGLHLLVEIAEGDVDPYQESRFRTAQGWLGYRTRGAPGELAHIEPTFRASYGELGAYSIRGTGGTLLTPGLNLYLDPLNRLMVNYDVWLPEGDARRESSLKMMFQLAF